jgi:cytochrome c2
MNNYTIAMRKISSIICSVLLVVFTNNANAGDYASGEKIFKANCASCHNMEKNLTGPALKGILDRAPSEEWIYKWVRNNNTLRASGDAYANKIFKDWNGAAMNVFEWMSDEQLSDVVTYITTYTGKTESADSSGPKLIDCEEKEPEKDYSTLYLIFGIVLLSLLIIAIFSGINRSLKNAKAIQDGLEPEEPKTFYEAVGDFAVNRKKSFGLIVIAIVLTLAKIGWDYLSTIGVSGGNGFEKTENVQNYKPTQPINFRHDIHVKQNQIDCEYCHSGVLETKHAIIPSANVCMNCHAAVNEAHCSGEEEIKKIYEHTGWDPNKMAYLHADGKYYDVPREDKPIKWVKVHNLQDFVYFNHAQHVVVGGLECKSCHGDMENMGVAQQYAPLTMGWCIDCHRKTEINTELKYSGKPNNYYIELHDQFKESWKHKADFNFTVEKIGGLECGKCHY